VTGFDDAGLSYHGDAELAPGLVDLAVNVRLGQPPDWLREIGRETGGAVRAAGEPRAPFILIQVPGRPQVRDGLRRSGFAVRRGDTFPGLGPDWLRVAVRDQATSEAFAGALRAVLSEETT
jgi:histidinol-phosphate/aromatic aminotransferase/cobyric acid decarboxylase-like protein